jgi:hypothetical protein
VEPAVSAKTTRAFVDAVEAGVARLLVGEQAFTLPLALLPAGLREGDWVDITLARAPAPPDDTEARRARLSKDDPGGDIDL